MLARGRGRIINTASMASLLVPHPQKQIAYNASKAAVVKITQAFISLFVLWERNNPFLWCP